MESAAAKLAIALIAGSVIWALAGGLGAYLTMTPLAVLGSGMIWQPFTYVFIAMHPFGVIFGALITWGIGGALEMSWGRRRFLWYAIGVPVAAAFVAALLGFLWPSMGRHTYGGGTVLLTALWVGYGLSIGREGTNFWGMPLSGNAFAGIGIGFVALNAAFARSLVPVFPDIVAIGLVFAYLRLGSPREGWLRLQDWRLRQRLRGRSRHLRVISKDRNMPRDSDRFLH